MSLEQTKRAWAVRHPEIDGIGKVVLMRMADFSADDGSSVFASVPRIAADCCIGERTAQRAIQALLKTGMLILVAVEDPARRRGREYRLNLPEPVSERHPRQSDTPVTSTPKGCQSDTAPPSERHPYPRQSDTLNGYMNSHDNGHMNGHGENTPENVTPAALDKTAKPAKPVSSKRQKVTFPNNWSLGPSEAEDAARILETVPGLSIQPNREWDQFRDHHLKQGSIFSDWPAAWRTWMRNAVKYAERDASRPMTASQRKAEGGALLERLVMGGYEADPPTYDPEIFLEIE